MLNESLLGFEVKLFWNPSRCECSRVYLGGICSSVLRSSSISLGVRLLETIHLGNVNFNATNICKTTILLLNNHFMRCLL